MRIECVVLNYNDAPTTTQFVGLIKNNKLINKIVIVDNNSNTETKNALKLLKEDKVDLIFNSINGGYGAGNNVGINYALDRGADYIIVSNPDVIISENALAKTIEFLETNKEYVVCSPVSIKPNGDLSYPIAWKRISKFKEIVSCGLLGSRLFRRSSYYTKNDIANADYIDVFSIPGSFFVIKSKTFKFQFNEKIFLFCEEKYLGFCAEQKGYKIALLNNCSYIHNHSVTINKKYNSYEKKKLWLDSKQKLIKSCYHINFFEAFMLKIIVLISKIEYRLATFMIRRK